MDMYYFPLWEKGVHDLLQKHFRSSALIFLAYCRSVLGSDTAEDAMEMEMAEFKDFVDECGLETKSVNFDVMTNAFIKANATNSAQVRDAHHESRRTAATKMDGRTTKEVGKVTGTTDGGGGQEGPGARALRVHRHARAHRLPARQPDLWQLWQQEGRRAPAGLPADDARG